MNLLNYNINVQSVVDAVSSLTSCAARPGPDAPHQPHHSVILRRMFVYWIFIFKLWIFLSRIYNILWIKDAMSGSVWFYLLLPLPAEFMVYGSMGYKLKFGTKLK